MSKRFNCNGWALFPLRLIVGFGFTAHGYAKLRRGPANFASVLTSLDVPQPYVMAWITSVLEFLGGISIMAGAFVVLLSIPLAVVMLTAMFSVHLQYGFSSVRLKAVTGMGAEFGPIGYELNLLYIAALLALAVSGSGKLSLDNYLRLRKQREASTRQHTRLMMRQREVGDRNKPPVVSRTLDLPPAPNRHMTDNSTPIDCETAVRQLWDYLDGRLPAVASRDMEAHLEVCGSCPPHFAFARRLRRALAASVPPDALPDEEVRLRDRIRVALQRMADGPDDMKS